MDATKAGEAVITLWLDKTSDPENPAWVVSRDVNDTTTTLATYAYDDYGTARNAAEKHARNAGLRYVEERA